MGLIRGPARLEETIDNRGSIHLSVSTNSLLEGLAEKEIAGELGLSVPTVHEYVTDLYRHFRVGTRAELLALFLRRRNGPAREWLGRFGGN